MYLGIDLGTSGVKAFLMDANQRFIARFRHMEKSAAANGQKLEDLSLQDLEELWQEAKK